MLYSSGSQLKETSFSNENVIHARGESVVAIDPGSSKCGIAIVSCDLILVFRCIVSRDELNFELRRLVNLYSPSEIVVGNGTGGKTVLESIRSQVLSIPASDIDEGHTTELARTRFLKEVPAKGLQRLLPAALRTPPRPIDDYAATILAERFWELKSQNDSN